MKSISKLSISIISVDTRYSRGGENSLEIITVQTIKVSIISCNKH